jgi:hypothetical protein
VNPLVIAGALRELIDLFLIDHMPAGNAQLLADMTGHIFEGQRIRHHQLHAFNRQESAMAGKKASVYANATGLEAGKPFDRISIRHLPTSFFFLLRKA